MTLTEALIASLLDAGHSDRATLESACVWVAESDHLTACVYVETDDRRIVTYMVDLDSIRRRLCSEDSRLG